MHGRAGGGSTGGGRPGGFGGPGGNRGNFAAEFIKRLMAHDKNKDGKITRQEASEQFAAGWSTASTATATG